MRESATANKRAMTEEQFSFFCRLVHEGCGIHLTEEKRYLAESRLGLLVERLGMSSIDSLYWRAKYEQTPELNRQIIELFTTNETLFFRDKSPFEFLARVALPDLLEQKKSSRVLRIWSAACSSGQEACSVLMTISERFPELLGWNFELLATDISERALARAREGVYSHLEVQRGLSMDLLGRYFTKVPSGWRFDESLRGRVRFERLNLQEASPGLGQFDIIFSRYVLIYFDLETKRRIFEKFYNLLNPKGYLFLGASEGVFGITEKFFRKTHENCVFYQPA